MSDITPRLKYPVCLYCTEVCRVVEEGRGDKSASNMCALRPPRQLRTRDRTVACLQVRKKAALPLRCPTDNLLHSNSRREFDVELFEVCLTTDVNSDEEGLFLSDTTSAHREDQSCFQSTLLGSTLQWYEFNTRRTTVSVATVPDKSS